MQVGQSTLEAFSSTWTLLVQGLWTASGYLLVARLAFMQSMALVDLFRIWGAGLVVVVGEALQGAFDGGFVGLMDTIDVAEPFSET